MGLSFDCLVLTAGCGKHFCVSRRDSLQCLSAFCSSADRCRVCCRWVLQSSKKVFYLMFTLYLFQVVTAFVYFCNVDGSIIEDVSHVSSARRWPQGARLAEELWAQREAAAHSHSHYCRRPPPFFVSGVPGLSSLV